MNNRTSLGDLGYTWDANKNKTSESITGVMSGYGFTAAGTTYDNEDRLTGFSRAATSGPALLSQSWNLTTVGDWTSVTTNGTAQSRTHGPTHELLTAGGQNVATDVKGNITTLPANLRPSGSTTAMNLTWDSDNKLRSADIDANGTADVNFQYDALGRRVARSGTGGSEVYVQMDQQTIADYPVGGAATTPTFRYVYASYIDEPVVRKTAGTGGTLVYFHRNHQYSVTAITTSAGAISERYAYTAYGQPTILNASGTVISATTLSNRYTYTGREWDATLGLHHFRARWMSPSAGRFLGRDPIGYDISSLLYDASFMVVGLDPSGESPCSENPLSTGVPCSAAEARQAVGRCARECAANGYTYRGEGLICCTKGVGRGVIKACECRTSKNCTTSMLFPLHKKMHSFCDKPGCAGLDPSKESDCKQIRPRIADLGRCIFYREKIQDCFTPGEPDWDGHIIQILGKKAAKNNCEIKHKICCMKIK
jgi:RHS repeat-associated protein